MVPVEWLPHIPDVISLRVFVAILAHADRDGWCFPKTKTLAVYAATCQRTVRRALRKLEKIGAVEVRLQPGTWSQYRALPPPEEVRTAECPHPPKVSEDRAVPSLPRTKLCPPPPDRALSAPSRSDHVSDHVKKPAARRAGADAHESDQANDLATEALRETGGMTQAQRDANKAKFHATLREAVEKGLFRAR
jgi:hypothetical protein